MPAPIKPAFLLDIASAESEEEEEDYEIIESIPISTKMTSEKLEIQEESLDDIL